VTGVLLALEAIVSVPDRAPAAAGVNVIGTVQLLPGAIGALHPLPIANSGESARIDATLIGAEPFCRLVFVTLRDFGLVVAGPLSVKAAEPRPIADADPITPGVGVGLGGGVCTGVGVGVAVAVDVAVAVAV
jgi:hypothetical protein